MNDEIKVLKIVSIETIQEKKKIYRVITYDDGSKYKIPYYDTIVNIREYASNNVVPFICQPHRPFKKR